MAVWLGGAAWRYDLAVWSPAMGDGSSKPGSVSRDSVLIVSVGRAGWRTWLVAWGTTSLQLVDQSHPSHSPFSPGTGSSPWTTRQLRKPFRLAQCSHSTPSEDCSLPGKTLTGWAETFPVRSTVVVGFSSLIISQTAVGSVFFQVGSWVPWGGLPGAGS